MANGMYVVQPEWANYARWQGRSQHDGQLLIGGGASMDDLANFAAAVADECAKVAETVPVEFFASIPGQRQAQAHRAATAAAIRSKFSKG